MPHNESRSVMNFITSKPLRRCGTSIAKSENARKVVGMLATARFPTMFRRHLPLAVIAINVLRLEV